MRALATGNESIPELAKMFDATVGGIRAFAVRHAQKIAEIRENLEDQFAGLWIASKENRLAVYEKTIEESNDEIQRILMGGRRAGEPADDDAAEEPVVDTSDALARLHRTVHRAVRQSAEELGQLPSRVAVTFEGQPVRHEIVGVDVDKI